MKFASLGSGSEGNGLLVSSGIGESATTVLIDCGFGIRETERRLARLHTTPESLSGILVTHEHQDHVGGVFKLAKRYRIPVWLSYGTFRATEKEASTADFRICQDGEPIDFGNLELLPYTVPHDAREPLQFVASNGHRQLGVLTDAGHSTSHMISVLSKSDALLLECNHNRHMLDNSTYPPFLRRRIGGDYGHLSNEATAHILSQIDQSRLRKVIGAHLSRQNNTAELARQALTGALASDGVEVAIACQDEGFHWIDIA